ncbi:MAG: outer membrane beta-barrel protein [Verrucomicrobiota bacterium]|nr:outer membrane beta-barrel protein [Verrucomicrobiota bacterium]
MKKLTLSVCAFAALASGAFAGTSTYSSSRDVKQVEQAPCPTWYADNELNVGVWGTYAATTNSYRTDRYLGVDHAFGGGLDAKYFFRRYFGVGVSGFGLSLNNNADRRFVTQFDNNDFAGGVVGTLTLRYPIPCTRFAPYAFVGGGGIWGGGNQVNNPTVRAAVTNNNDGGRLMAQYGAGVEVRFTPHVGLTTDVVLNQVEGRDNEFVMVRTGLNFAF